MTACGCLNKLSQVFFAITDSEVKIPKSVVLNNDRLSRVHFVLRLCVGVLTVLRFAVLRQWTSELFDGFVEPTIRSDNVMLRSAGYQHYQAAQGHFCNPAGPSREVKIGGRKFNASCPKFCLGTTPDVNCVNPFELLALHATPRDALFVTGIVDTSISNNGLTVENVFFMPYDNGMEVSFDYAVWLPKTFGGTHGITNEISRSTGNTLRLNTKEHISTRLLRPDGSVASVFQPGEAMKFTLLEVVALAGKPDFFGAETGNMSSGLFTGLQIELDIQCKVSSTNVFKQTCDAKFMSVSKAVPDRSRLRPDGVLRSYYGVYIKYQTSCSYEVLDVDSIYQAIIFFLVIWSAPRQVIAVLARYGLGGTSKIYSRVLVESFNIRDTLVGLLLRLMIGNTCFKSIAGEDDNIDRRELVTVLSNVFGEEDGAHKHVITSVATLCWQSLASRQATRDHLTLYSINSALLARETVRFSDLMRLFNVQKQKGVLERSFMPRELRSLDHDAELAEEVLHSKSTDSVLLNVDEGNNPEKRRERDEGELELLMPDPANSGAAANSGRADPTLHQPHDQSEGEMVSESQLSLALDGIKEIMPIVRELSALLDSVSGPTPPSRSEPSGVDPPCAQTSSSELAATDSGSGDAHEHTPKGSQDIVDGIDWSPGGPNHSMNDVAEAVGSADARE